VCCVVRLAPEKEPERFVRLVAALAASGALERLGLTPLMVAPPASTNGSDTRFAEVRACCTVFVWHAGLVTSVTLPGQA
jgi:hypothetical protein